MVCKHVKLFQDKQYWFGTLTSCNKNNVIKLLQDKQYWFRTLTTCNKTLISSYYRTNSIGLEFRLPVIKQWYQAITGQTVLFTEEEQKLASFQSMVSTGLLIRGGTRYFNQSKMVPNFKECCFKIFMRNDQILIKSTACK